MATINGVFEPFAKYVKDQLEVRRIILANPEISWHKFDGVPIGSFFYKGFDFQLDKRFDNESFYAYTFEKQCTIRMKSGVAVIQIFKKTTTYSPEC